MYTWACYFYVRECLSSNSLSIRCLWSWGYYMIFDDKYLIVGCQQFLCIKGCKSITFAPFLIAFCCSSLSCCLFHLMIAVMHLRPLETVLQTSHALKHIVYAYCTPHMKNAMVYVYVYVNQLFLSAFLTQTCVRVQSGTSFIRIWDISFYACLSPQKDQVQLQNSNFLKLVNIQICSTTHWHSGWLPWLDWTWLQAFKLLDKIFNQPSSF